MQAKSYIFESIPISIKIALPLKIIKSILLLGIVGAGNKKNA